MMKARILVAAMTLGMVLGAAAEPAMARQPIAPGGQSIYCATREMGNPFSKLCDYVAWSKWRSRGGWDASLDNACYFNPHYKPVGCFPH